MYLLVIFLILTPSILVPLLGDDSAASMYLYYLLGILGFTNLACRVLLKGSSEIRDLKLVLPTILYAVLGMVILLVSSDKATLLGKEGRVFTSGLTIMASVINFYYIALSFSTKRKLDAIWKVLVAGIILFLLGQIFQPIGFDLAGLMMLFATLLLAVNLPGAKSVWYKFTWLIGLIISSIYTFAYVMSLGNPWSLVTFGLVAMIVGGLQLGKDPIGELSGLVSQVRKRNWGKIYREQLPLLLIVVGVLVAVFAWGWVLLAEYDLFGAMERIVGDFTGSLDLIDRSVVTLIAGSAYGSRLYGDALWIYITQYSGLIGLLSLLGLTLVAWVERRKRALGKSLSWRTLTNYILLIGIPIWGVFANVPNGLFIIWWLAWGLLAAEVNIGHDNISDTKPQKKVAGSPVTMILSGLRLLGVMLVCFGGLLMVNFVYRLIVEGGI